MLLRKKGTASAIVAVMLLIALVTAVDCLVNNINSQTTLLTKLAASGDTYLILTKTSTCLSDSQVNPELVDQVKLNSNVKYAAFLSPTQAVITHNGTSYAVDAVGTDNPAAYFNNHHTYINGSISRDNLQATIGIVLANLVSIQKNQTLNMTIGGKTSEFNVTGVMQDNAQSDSQIIMPLETLESTNGAGFGYIEFSVADVGQAEVTIANISRFLPSDTKIVGTQQVTTFASDINNQTVAFLGVWSIAVYAVIAAASYVTTTRVVSEAEYELDTLRVLGAKKPLRFSLVLSYGLIVALIGSVVGVALGVVGTQVASTIVRWVWSSSFLAPFLGLPQVFTVLLLSAAAALFGCAYPAYRAGYRASGGNTL
jgi:ABC-type lipoprotein release transport system permease subunit